MRKIYEVEFTNKITHESIALVVTDIQLRKMILNHKVVEIDYIKDRGIAYR